MPQNKLLALGGFFGTLTLWLLSFIAFSYPTLHVFLVVVFLVGFAILALRAFPAALIILFAELVIGNKGALFSVPVGGTIIGIRLALFAIVIGLWFVHAARSHKLFALRSTPYGLPWLLFLVVLAAGVIHGYLRAPSALVYFDANGYLFYLALLPLSLVLFEVRWWHRLLSVLLGASTAIAVLTLFISLSFSTLFNAGDFTSATSITEEQKLALQGEVTEDGLLAQTTDRSADKIYLDEDEGGGMTAVYRWLRDTGNGEVSFIGSVFFRVFFTSHVFLFLVFLWLFAKVGFQGAPWSPDARFFTGLLLLDSAAMVVSFSRSLWAGVIFGVCVTIALFPKKARIRSVAALLSVIVLATLAVTLFFPQVGQIFLDRLVSLVRPTQELAASTRLSLLAPIWERIQERPLAGWGFGTTVSFLAPIPGTDIVETIKVYLFEWSYLDLMVKTGSIGLGIFLLFLGSAVREAVRAFRLLHTPETITLLAGMTFLILTHVTTPYLNHPLGIGALLLLMAGALFMTHAHAKPQPHD